MDDVDDIDIPGLIWEANVWITLGKNENIVQAYWFDYSDRNEPFIVMGTIGTPLFVARRRNPF